MPQKMHKLFLTTCDLAEPRSVTAAECSACSRGSVIDNKARVICSGETKYFTAPCYYDMRAAATVAECEQCPFGEIGVDRLRVYCDRM